MSVSEWEIPYKNNSGETIPAYGIIRFDGVVSSVGGRVIISAKKPNTYGSQYTHYLNGPVATLDGKYGSCTGIFPALMAVDTETFISGECVGPRNGLWTGEIDTGGFVSLETKEVSGSGVILVTRSPMLSFVGKFTTNVAQGGQEIVESWWDGTSGTTSQTINPVYAISHSFTTSDFVNVHWMNGRWEAYKRTC